MINKRYYNLIMSKLFSYISFVITGHFIAFILVLYTICSESSNNNICNKYDGATYLCDYDILQNQFTICRRARINNIIPDGVYNIFDPDIGIIPRNKILKYKIIYNM